MPDIKDVLLLARWAPSGDNEQPWRVKILGNDRCVVTVGYFLDTLFHLRRISDHIALGCFLENARLAAGTLGFEVRLSLQPAVPGEPPAFELDLIPRQGPAADPLAAFIETRRVNRFPYALTPLTKAQRQAMESALPPGYRVMWFEGAAKKSFTRMATHAARIRYMIPEMYEVHSRVIDWEHPMSERMIPARALGVPSPFLGVLKWMLGSWRRMEAYNHFFAGDKITAFQLEWVPFFFSGAGIALIADQPPVSALDWVNAGGAIQRFWLAATAQGLAHQPAFTALIFSKYADEGKALSALAGADPANLRLREELSALLGGDAQRRRTVWLGRVGSAPLPLARSLRLPLEDIIQRT